MSGESNLIQHKNINANINSNINANNNNASINSNINANNLQGANSQISSVQNNSLMNSFEVINKVKIVDSFEILTDKDLFEDQKSQKIARLQLKHNECLKKSADLKKKLRKAIEKKNREEALKIRLELSKLEREAKEVVYASYAENEEHERFLLTLANLEELRNNLVILLEARDSGMDVQKEIENTEKKLELEKSISKNCAYFKKYEKNYNGEGEEPQQENAEIKKEKEIKEGAAIADLRERERKLKDNKYKSGSDDGTRMKEVKDKFSTLARAIENPGVSEYAEQRKVIFKGYEDFKVACQKYLKNHEKKWYKLSPSPEQKVRIKMVEEYLDRADFEQKAIVKNMEILRQTNPNASWGQALALTREPARLHMTYMQNLKKNSKDPGNINWGGAPKWQGDLYSNLSSVFSLPISDKFLDEKNRGNLQAMKELFSNYVENMKKLREKGNADYTELPEMIKYEMGHMEELLNILLGGIKLIEDKNAGIRPGGKAYKKELDKIKEKLNEKKKGASVYIENSGIVNIHKENADNFVKGVAKNYFLDANEQKRKETRLKKDYILTYNPVPSEVQLSEHQINKELNSTRSIIEKVIKRDVYKKYDEKVTKTEAKDRVIPMKHALGTKQKEQGARVISVDMAGSGFKEFIKNQNGGHGKISIGKLNNDDKTLFEKSYGKGLIVDGKNRDRYILEQGNLKKDSKIRYGIAGPLNFKGLMNKGDYSIENNVQYALYCIGMQVGPLITQWVNGKNRDKPICVNIQAHSRGAVAASKASIYLNNWLEEQLGENYDEFMKNFKVNIIQLDPVPGLGSNSGLNHELNLKSKDTVTETRSGITRKYKGYGGTNSLNSTTVFSMFCEYPSKVFPPQQVRGQDRIILKASRHGVDMEKVDISQLNVKGDGKIHRKNVVDVATMTGYRGSGYSEMPPGVYIEDENGALVRMRDLKEAAMVMEGLKSNLGDQQGRQDALKEVIKNWFIDNEYVDDTMTKEEVWGQLESDDLQQEMVKVKDAVPNNNIIEEELYKSALSSFSIRVESINKLYGQVPKDKKAAEKNRDDICRTLEKAIKDCKIYLENAPKNDHSMINSCSRLLSAYRAQLTTIEKESKDEFKTRITKLVGKNKDMKTLLKG